jgi:hypothetical protein
MWHSERNGFGYWLKGPRRKLDLRKQSLLGRVWQELLAFLLRAMSAWPT